MGSTSFLGVSSVITRNSKESSNGRDLQRSQRKFERSLLVLHGTLSGFKESLTGFRGTERLSGVFVCLGVQGVLEWCLCLWFLRGFHFFLIVLQLSLSLLHLEVWILFISAVLLGLLFLRGFQGSVMTSNQHNWQKAELAQSRTGHSSEQVTILVIFAPPL